MVNDTVNERKPAHHIDEPDTTVSAREAFGLSIDMQVPAFSEPSEYVPNRDDAYPFDHDTTLAIRSEEHTSELQSLMRISYAVFCLKKKKTKHDTITLCN